MNTNYNTFSISSQPFYDQYNQSYKNIMMVNIEPQGPLRKFVRRIQTPRLSPFQRDDYCNTNRCNNLSIQSLKGISSQRQYYNNNNYGSNNYGSNNACSLMTPDEIPDLISFLQANGYQIETQITNMLLQNNLRQTNQNLAFNVTYYGDKQPNIVYMR